MTNPRRELGQISLDTERWGGSQVIVVPGGTNGDITSVIATKQLVQGAWHYPISWNVLVVMTPAMNADETANANVIVSYTIGVGQGINTFAVDNVFTLAGGYAQVIDQRLLPAQDIQITASFSGRFKSAQPQSLSIAAWVAPQTEVHMFRDILDRLEQRTPEQAQWMPSGFQDVPLGYRRR